jgi:hypothetical protein
MITNKAGLSMVVCFKLFRRSWLRQKSLFCTAYVLQSSVSLIRYESLETLRTFSEASILLQTESFNKQ